MAVAIVAGNHLTAPWSGGGDTREYVTLARNMLAGDGYTFAHQPTAFRAPLYPLFLAAVMWLFPNVWAAVVHAIQFGLGLLTAGLCARLASRWFGPDAGRASLALALVLPSLAYFTGEILTECTAAALAIVFFLCLDEALQRSGRYALVALGISCGLAALERFNSAALAIAAVAAVFLWLPASTGEPRASAPFAKWFERERWARAFIVAAACVVVISPWLMHTWVAFHGRAIYSTHAGFAAVEGVLMPLGRTQPGETPIIENALGWGNWEVESNDPKRVTLGSEADLNRQAWRVAFGLWRNNLREFVPTSARKLGAFWLSTDQVLETGSFSLRNRLVRFAGVAAYWIILVLALGGWMRLRKLRPGAAGALLLCAVVLTLLHVPLTMNTRLRAPLFDPVLVVLAGGVASQALQWRSL